MWSSAPAATTETFTCLKCNFNICATDISTATAASSSGRRIHLHHPREKDAFKPGHPTHSAEPSGNQRTAAAIQRAADFLQTGRTFKTTYVHIDSDEALQPSISSLCYRRRKQHNTTYQDFQASSETFSL